MASELQKKRCAYVQHFVVGIDICGHYRWYFWQVLNAFRSFPQQKIPSKGPTLSETLKDNKMPASTSANSAKIEQSKSTSGATTKAPANVRQPNSPLETAAKAPEPHDSKKSTRPAVDLATPMPKLTKDGKQGTVKRSRPDHPRSSSCNSQLATADSFNDYLPLRLCC